MPESRAAGSSPADFVPDWARLLRRMVRYWPVVVICAIVAGGAGYVSAKREPPIYSASAMVQLADLDLSSVVAQLNLLSNGPDPETRADTIAKLSTGPAVLDAAATRLGIDPASLGGKVSSSAQRNTTLVTITATDGNPEQAAAIANAVRDAFVTVRRNQQHARLERAVAGVREQLDASGPNPRTSREARSLRHRLERLTSLQIVVSGGVEAAQRASVPSSPSSPRPKRTAMLALFVGGVFGVGLVLAIVLLDRRVSDPDELAELAGAPVLAVVPGRAGAAPSRVAPSGDALDALAIARAQLPDAAPGDPLTLLVTSAGSTVGQSGAAWGLAVASALAGRRVLFVEADVRAPTLAARLSLAPTPGLAELLGGTAEAAQIRRQVDVSVAGDPVRVDVIVAGTPPAAPAALLERAQTGDAFDEIGRAHDLVIIDGPEALTHADVRFLATHCDGVLAVARLGDARRGEMRSLAGIAATLNAPFIGMLAQGDAGLPSWSRPSTLLSRRSRQRPAYAAADEPSKSRVE